MIGQTLDFIESKIKEYSISELGKITQH